jgi:hypothetical protein
MTDLREHCVSTQVAEAVVDVLEVIEVEHDDREFRAGSPGSAQLRVHHFHRMTAIETSGERIANTVLVRLVVELRVLDGRGEQRRGCRENTSLCVGERRLRCDADCADGAAADDERKTMKGAVFIGGWRARVGNGACGGPLDCRPCFLGDWCQRTPLAARAKHRPYLTARGELREVIRRRATNRLAIECASERLTKRDEAFHSATRVVACAASSRISSRLRTDG